MPTVEASIVIAAPVADVFAYMDDWTHTTEYTQDLISWEPTGETTHGLGSTFAAKMKVGPTTQESTLEITQWEQDRVIGWEPRAGLQQSGSYTFVPRDGETEVQARLEVQLPGGIAGRVLGNTLTPAIRSNVNKTLENLKRILERG